MRRNLFYPAFILTLFLLCSAGFLLYLLDYRMQMDTEPPTISFAEELLELSTGDPKETLLQGVTASDNVDGDVTASVVVASVQRADEDGSIRVTYAAFDAAGNVTKAVRKARYTDYKSPRFSLSHSLTFSDTSPFDIFSIVTAEDALDGDISHRIRITSLDDTIITSVGMHQVKLQVSNSLNETVTLELPVEVYSSGSYDSSLTLTDYLVYLPAGNQLDAESYLKAFIRGNSVVSLQGTLPKDYSLDIKSNVEPEVPGVYTVEYRVSQTVGTTDSAKPHTGYAKLIVVVEG